MWALYRRQYLAIGAIKLLGDALNFAGPFLLQLLLRCAQAASALEPVPDAAYK
jgi:hypothetical protein